MAGWIEDRWLKKKVDPVTGKREPTKLWGTNTKRYRVCGIPGVPRRSFTTAAAAKRWKDEASADTSRGVFYDPRRGDMTLRTYVEQEWWPNLRKPPTTKASMRPRVFKHIVPHVGALSLNRVGSDEIKAWLTRAERDIDVNTLITTWMHFSSIMQSAYKAKRIPENPFRDPDLKAPSKPPSKAQAWPQETLFAVRGELGERYQVLIDLAVGAGLRQGECFGFSPDDVAGEEINVTRQIVRVGGRLAFAPPKGNKTRVAPCPSELAAKIKEHARRFPTVDVTLPWLDPDRPSLEWADRPKRTVRLLVTTPRTGGKSGGAINRSSFDDKQWKPALVRAGVIPAPKEPTKFEMPREDGFHVLRHTFASVVLAAGETINQLAAWLGHSDPAFTYRTYVHFLPKSGSHAMKALGAWLGVPPEATEGGSPAKTPSVPPQTRSDLVSDGVVAAH